MMGHFVFLLYVVSFAIGVASFFFAILYYLKERVSWLIYYLVFLALFGFLLFIYAMQLYQVLALDKNYDSIFNTVLYFAVILATSLLLYIIPMFLFHAIGFPSKVFKVILSTTTSSLYFIFSIIELITNLKLFYITSIIVFFISLSLNIIIGGCYIKNVKDSLLQKVILLLGILTIVFLPFFMFDMILSFMGINITIKISDITMPFFYLWWNIIMLGYFFWYFSRLNNKEASSPSIIEVEQSLNVKNFHLTKRESEIVDYILQGKSNRDIATMLHISLNTVNNHVANVYEKTDVKNRVELVNIIKK